MAMTRERYVKALQDERAFVEQYPMSDADRTRRLGDIDAELARYQTKPVRRGAPETREVG